MYSNGIILALVLVSCQSVIEAQQKTTDVSQRYFQARTYIDTFHYVLSYLATDAPRVLGETASISVDDLGIWDSLAPISTYNFRRALITRNVGSIYGNAPKWWKDSILRIAIAEERQRLEQFAPAVLPIPALPKATDTSKVIAFFSPLYDSLLVVEILPLVEKRGDLTYKNLKNFSTGLKFLFIFDQAGLIKEVLHVVIQYD